MIRSSVCRLALLCIALAPSQPTRVAAQSRGAIAGTVTDSTRRALAEVEIILRPVGRRTRTDSSGKFAFSNLKNGGYSVAARKLGYVPEFYDVKLSDGGTISLTVALAKQVALDTVRVSARGECPLFTLDGFFCRQRFGRGLFLDYPDIDDHGEVLTGDLFRHIKGFAVTLRSTLHGMTPIPVRLPHHCWMVLVNGHIVESWDDVPRYTRQLSSMELYLRPDSVPPEILHEMYFYPRVNSSPALQRCEAVVFWTVDAPLSSPRDHLRYLATRLTENK